MKQVLGSEDGQSILDSLTLHLLKFYFPPKNGLLLSKAYRFALRTVYANVCKELAFVMSDIELWHSCFEDVGSLS